MDVDGGFSGYVAARRPELYRIAYLLCGDPHRAEDVVQDALMRLYAVWGRASVMDNLDGYVRRIIVNAHYSDRRRPWRRETSRETPDRALDPGFPIEEADAIRSALRQLPPGQRRVVVLRHIVGLTIEATAFELDISPGTVKSQGSDAMATLRRALTPTFRAATNARGEDR